MNHAVLNRVPDAARHPRTSTQLDKALSRTAQLFGMRRYVQEMISVAPAEIIGLARSAAEDCLGLIDDRSSTMFHGIAEHVLLPALHVAGRVLDGLVAGPR